MTPPLTALAPPLGRQPVPICNWPRGLAVSISPSLQPHARSKQTIVALPKLQPCRPSNNFPRAFRPLGFLHWPMCASRKNDPGKVPLALYELARAAALDPVKGMADAKWQQASVVPYLEKSYTQFHGADPNGLKALKELAVQSPLPPAGFVIKSAAEIAREQEADFESKNPELALWMKIKEALSGSDGEHYFQSELRDRAVPELEGVLVEARPTCRPTELDIAIRLPNDPQNAHKEITLKLQKPLTGKPELGSELHWTGVATEFSRDPFHP